MTNPLLDFSGLPRFSDIRTEHITPAVEELLARGHSIVEKILCETAAPTWQNFVQPMTDVHERLFRAWSQVSHLNAVMNSPELREVYNSNLPKITKYYAEISQNQALFEKFKKLHNDSNFKRLSCAQKMVVENELRDFRLGGVDLEPEQKKNFLNIQEELSTLSSRFSDNLLDATNNFVLHTKNVEDVSGIPKDVLQTAREAAKKDGVSGWKFTLHAPSYQPIMQYADSRELRRKMYHAYSTRASEVGVADHCASRKADWDNTPLICKILELRKEEAKILGFDCYAEVSLVSKMASTPTQVLDFLVELAAKAKPFAKHDLEELIQFASDQLGLNKLESWDLAYVSEKLRVERYAFSDKEVKQYFPETKALSGMFKLVENLYSITITSEEETSNVQLWHPDVKFFNINDTDGKLIGQFYIDLYARPGKKGGAWMDDAINRRRIETEELEMQTPVAYLNCNFAKPVNLDGQMRPALFTHDEVIILFHEFGHGLHHLLTQVEELGVSGINGVEWDAVELPSQYMENFCWEWEVLAYMTQHVDSGAPLPRKLFDKMLAAKNFQSGLQILRQIEYSLFDMHLHFDFNLDDGKTTLQLLDKIREQVAVVIPPGFNRFPNSFSHIFAGGYAAGYYSYKWAEVLSADAYSMFEESADGVMNEKISARFRDEILAVGGSRTALESFIALRGREPKIDALLRHSGMAVK
jgi:oligopeptidase A